MSAFILKSYQQQHTLDFPLQPSPPPHFQVTWSVVVVRESALLPAQHQCPTYSTQAEFQWGFLVCRAECGEWRSGSLCGPGLSGIEVLMLPQSLGLPCLQTQLPPPNRFPPWLLSWTSLNPSQHQHTPVFSEQLSCFSDLQLPGNASLARNRPLLADARLGRKIAEASKDTCPGQFPMPHPIPRPF